VPLGFPGRWRFNPPSNAGGFFNDVIPAGAITEFVGLIMRVATQGNRREVLEHFKGYFCRACGTTHVWSSNVGWAETDLWTFATQAAHNAPLFIEAFYDACESFREDDDPDVFAPDVEMINAMLARHDIGYVLQPPRLELRGAEAAAPLIRVEEPPPTLAEHAAQILAESLGRSDQLLAQGRDREAVQESLWLLETISTAFRGVETETGTIAGRYFNQIARELRQASRGTTLERVLAWTTTLHGYLSSPTGGGVRHGIDLRAGAEIGPAEARLFCNLIRSYLSFLLREHERLSRRS